MEIIMDIAQAYRGMLAFPIPWGGERNASIETTCLPSAPTQGRHAKAQKRGL